MSLFENVREILKERSIPVIEFEKNIGLQRGGFYKWKDHDPGVSFVKRASEYLVLPVDELIM